MAYRTLREEELSFRLKWFIEIRWLFLLALIFVVLFSDLVLKISLPLFKCLVVALVIAIYNSALFVYHRYLKDSQTETLRKNQIEAYIQIVMDLITLTVLFHFSGAVENPFILIYLFHAIIASILLTPAEVIAVGLLSYSLFVSLLTLEYFEIIPHYHMNDIFLKDIYRNVPHILELCLAMMFALFATIFLSSSIVHGIRKREKELILTRNVLQQKSEDLKNANLEKQKQLVQSEKLASLGQLVSGCAHEINNPIQFILGNMRIFHEAFQDIIPILDTLTEEDKEYTIARLKYPFFRENIPVLLEDMTTGAKRIRDIVADLKTFARRDERRLDEEVDLNHVVQICLRLVHNKIKHHKVEENLDPELPTVLGSENKLEQVVMATLINTAEALADRSNGIIKIATRTEDGGRSISLSISDNGPGMTENIKNRIFDAFFTTKQRSGGTGLGLSISYGIIEEHGGHIEVDSQPGKGATFIFHLPVDRVIKDNEVGKIFQSRLEVTYGDSCNGSLRYVFDEQHKVQECYIYSDIPLGSPIAVSIWVRGDGSDHRLRMAYRDHLNDRYTVSFSENALKNTAWHVVIAHIPDNAVFPLRLESIYILKNSGDSDHTSGAIGFDDLSAHYPPDI